MAQQADGTIYINTAIETDGFKVGGKEIEAAVRRMANSVEDIGNKAKIALQKQADAFVKQNQAYAMQEQKVDSLRQKLEELSNQKVETTEFAEIGRQIENDIAKLDKLKEMQEQFLAAGGKESSSAYQRREMQIEQLTNSIEHAKSEQEELLNAGGAYVPVDTSGVERQLFAEEQRLQQMHDSLGTSYEALKERVDAYNQSSTQASETTNQNASAAESLIKKITGASNGMKHFEKATRRSNSSLKKGLSMVLKYGFGVRSFFFLFRKIRTAVVDAFKSLAQFDKTTNASISAVKSSLTQLKNSLSTALNPLLNAIAPALTNIINMLSKAVTYVGMFIASLTGQSTFTRAKAVQEDYASSLSDTASSAKDAEKALKGYLSPIDEINKMEKKDDASSASTGLSPSDMFETVKLPDLFGDIDTSKFYNLGKKLADSLNKVLKETDWGKMAQTISNGIKSALDLAIGFVEDFDWEAGVDTIFEFFENIDWAGIIGRMALLLLELLKAHFSIKNRWYQNYAKLLADFFEAIGWDSIAGFFRGISDKIEYYSNKIKDLFQYIIDKVKDLLGIHSPSTVFAEIGMYLMEGLFIGISGWIDKIVALFTKLKDSIVNTWNSVKSKSIEVWNNIVSAIKGAINSIIGSINGMISGATSGINEIIKVLNKLSFDIPDWVPKYGGNKFGFDLKPVTSAKIPYLATGAVIPPNAPFMAMLGDQKNGRNLEMPENLLRRIVREESKSGGISGTIRIPLYMNGRQIFEAFLDEAKLRQMASGRNVLDF